MDDSITEKIYKEDSEYFIYETTHDSSFPTSSKRWFPNKFIFVSAFNAFRYSMYDAPYSIIEYPVDTKEKEQKSFQSKLNLDSGWKHVINVGLFTPRKNQAATAVLMLAKKWLPLEVVLRGSPLWVWYGIMRMGPMFKKQKRKNPDLIA